MARRLIDLSVPPQNTVYADPPGHGPAIEYIDHDQSVGDILNFFPGLKKEHLPDGKGWAVERVQLSTHNGTHIDAPWHYHPTMNEGERAATIDEIPLDWCLQPGVKLDFRHFEDGCVVTAADVEAELKRIGRPLKPLEIVVVNTSAGVKYGARPDYVPCGCGMGAEATLYLLNHGVRVTGIDGWSWDAPFVHTAKKYAATHDASLIWEGHKAGATSAIGISRSCTISKLYLPTASRSLVSRPRSKRPPPAGRASWPLSNNSSDAHQGIKAAVAKLMNATGQRCRVHTVRNALAHAGKSSRRVVSAFMATALPKTAPRPPRPNGEGSPISSGRSSPSSPPSWTRPTTTCSPT